MVPFIQASKIFARQARSMPTPPKMSLSPSPPFVPSPIVTSLKVYTLSLPCKLSLSPSLSSASIDRPALAPLARPFPSSSSPSTLVRTSFFHAGMRFLMSFLSQRVLQ